MHLPSTHCAPGLSHGLETHRLTASFLWGEIQVLLLEEEMGNHSSVLAWRIPGTGEPGGLLSMGSHRTALCLLRSWRGLGACRRWPGQGQPGGSCSGGTRGSLDGRAGLPQAVAVCDHAYPGGARRSWLLTAGPGGHPEEEARAPVLTEGRMSREKPGLVRLPRGREHKDGETDPERGCSSGIHSGRRGGRARPAIGASVALGQPPALWELSP